MLTNGPVVLLPCTVANNVFENVRMTLSNVILARADGASVPLTTISGGVVLHPVFVHPDGHVDGFFTAQPDVPYVEAAARLGVSEGSLKMVVYRMRRRYAQLFREEIAQTVEDPSAIEDEIRHVLAVLAG